MKSNKLTEMQAFALEKLRELGQDGASGSYIGAMWKRHRSARCGVDSRSCFGFTSAGYRAARTLVEKGLAKQVFTKTTGGYTVETFYAL